MCNDFKLYQTIEREDLQKNVLGGTNTEQVIQRIEAARKEGQETARMIFEDLLAFINETPDDQKKEMFDLLKTYLSKSTAYIDELSKEAVKPIVFDDAKFQNFLSTHLPAFIQGLVEISNMNDEGFTKLGAIIDKDTSDMKTWRTIAFCIIGVLIITGGVISYFIYIAKQNKALPVNEEDYEEDDDENEQAIDAEDANGETSEKK